MGFKLTNYKSQKQKKKTIHAKNKIKNYSWGLLITRHS